MTQPTDSQNVYGYLAAIQKRPSMYIGDESLHELQDLILGYYAALYTHGIDEGVPELSSHFDSWLRLRTGWSLSCGWARAIVDNSETRRSPLEVFFELVDVYRQLVPRTCCTVRLRPEHQPTGRRVVIGLDGLMEKPDVAELVQYEPEPLFFFRFRFGSKVRNQEVLLDNGTEATSIDFAIRWANEELNIGRDEWTRVRD